jgi:hypothetical protein
MRKYVRIAAKPTIDNPDSPTFCVDAMIDESNRIIGKHALFGLSGRFDSRDTEFYPFVLDPSGRVDFGMGYDEEANERFGETDLRERTIQIGELVTYTSVNYGLQRYRISEVQTLLSTG